MLFECGSILSDIKTISISTNIQIFCNIYISLKHFYFIIECFWIWGNIRGFINFVVSIKDFFYIIE